MSFFVVVVLTSTFSFLLRLLFKLDIQSNAWDNFQSFGSSKFLVNPIIKLHLH